MMRLTPCLAILAGTAALSAPAMAQDTVAQPKPWRLGEALGLPEGVRVEGSIRPRYEALANPFVAGRTENDEYIGLQTQIRVEFDLGAAFTAGGELLDHRFIAGNETGAVPGEIDTLEPAQAYLAWRPKDFLAAGADLNLTAGRFTMDIGSRRLSARANFRSLLQSFDGVRAVWTSPSHIIVTLAATSPVARAPSDAASAIDNEVALNRTQDNTHLSIAHLDAPLPFDMRGEVYLFDLDEDDASDAQTRNRDLSTLGLRLHRPAHAGRFDFDLEYVRQTGSVHATTGVGDVTPLDHDADMAHLEAGFTFDAPWSPRLALQFDYASGDDSPLDNRNERFDALFGDRSFEFGPTSIYGIVARANLVSPGIRLEVKPDGMSDAYIMVRHVALDSATDSYANTNVRDPSGASGDDVGVTIEGRYRHWLVKDSLRLSLGAATMLQGSFMERAPNATDQGDPVYGYTELTWSF